MHNHPDHIGGDPSHPHTHEHTHEHTHDGVAHSHAHTHEHHHDHAHPHDHDHLHGEGHTHDHSHECQDCASDCNTCGGCSHTPMQELMALMQYMVNHNAAHAKELADLAVQLEKAGSHAAFEQVMAAVSDFEKGNMRLSAVLASLK